MNNPHFVQARSTYKGTIESPRMHAFVQVHTTHINGDTDQRRMPLFEALEHQARWAMDCRAICIWPDNA